MLITAGIITVFRVAAVDAEVLLSSPSLHCLLAERNLIG